MNEFNFDSLKNIPVPGELIDRALSIPDSIGDAPAPRGRSRRLIAAAGLVLVCAVSIYVFFLTRNIADPPVRVAPAASDASETIGQPSESVVYDSAPTDPKSPGATEKEAGPSAVSGFTEPRGSEPTASGGAAQAPTVRPTVRSSSKPAQAPGVKPTEESAAKSTENPGVKPTERSTAKPTEKHGVKPTDKSGVKPTEKSTTNPAGKPAVKPEDKSGAKPTEKTTVKPTEKPAAKPTEKPAVKPVEEPTDSPDAPSASEPAITPTDAPWEPYEPSSAPDPPPSPTYEPGEPGDPEIHPSEPIEPATEAHGNISFTPFRLNGRTIVGDLYCTFTDRYGNIFGAIDPYSPYNKAEYHLVGDWVYITYERERIAGLADKYCDVKIYDEKGTVFLTQRIYL